jgi:RNA polymerase sigma-70 factor (ECF subfamily)
LPPEDAADVAQDVFLQAWTVLDTLREPAAFGGWIGAIARRRAIDTIRKQRPEAPLDDIAHSASNPHVSAEAAAVLDAIRLLPEAYRDTLMLRLVEGYSGPEIASLTGLTPGSVRVNLHRGFKLLKERMGST